MNPVILTSHSQEQTEELGRRTAQLLHPGDVVALYGCVGSGKTAFVRGLAAGLGIRDRVCSPTFALVHRYRGDRQKQIPYLSHYDFDRLVSPEELDDSGFYDALDAGDILALEWSERVEECLPQGTLKIRIQYDPAKPEERLFSLEDEAGRFDVLEGVL